MTKSRRKKKAADRKEDKINTQKRGKGRIGPAAVCEHQRPDITPVHSLAMHASPPFSHAPP
jgi:hypothetical protein